MFWTRRDPQGAPKSDPWLLHRPPQESQQVPVQKTKSLAMIWQKKRSHWRPNLQKRFDLPLSGIETPRHRDELMSLSCCPDVPVPHPELRASTCSPVWPYHCPQDISPHSALPSNAMWLRWRNLLLSRDRFSWSTAHKWIFYKPYKCSPFHFSFPVLLFEDRCWC